MVLKLKTAGLHHRWGCMFNILTCGNCALNIFLIVSNVYARGGGKKTSIELQFHHGYHAYDHASTNILLQLLNYITA